jgi:signal peptidase I
MDKECIHVAMTARSKGHISAVRIVIAAALIAMMVKAFLLDLVIVRGDSMLPAISPGTVAVVARFAYGLRLPFAGIYMIRWGSPSPGDIVLVKDAGGGARSSVKRVFETGPAFLKAEAGVLTGRGGSIRLATADSLRLAGQSFVPHGRAFIIGDNMEVSFDSRNYGPVPIEKIVGKVIVYAGGPSRAVSIFDSPKDAADDVDR